MVQTSGAAGTSQTELVNILKTNAELLESLRQLLEQQIVAIREITSR